MDHPKIARADHDVVDVIRARWSPRAFDAARPISRADQLRLFEAARWAPSSMNEQPWRFIVADRFEHPAAFAALLDALGQTNQTWARSAALLVVVSARKDAERYNCANPHAWYDTGQAIALLGVQATSMGIGLRQMAAFDASTAAAVGGIAPPYEPVVMIAIGYPGDVASLPLERHRVAEQQPRQRRSVLDSVRWLALAAAFACAAPAVMRSAPTPAGHAGDAAVRHYGYRVVHTFPHDPAAFTQGLIYKDGALYESTGQFGESTVRKVDLTTGKVLQKTPIDRKYFGEGLTDWQGTLIQLTWQSGVGFVYDQGRLGFKSSFRYSGEGWGLTHDATRLILSDGDARGGLRFLDPATFAETGRVIVKDDGAPVQYLNELEFIDGEVYANVWMTNRIARIDPASGNVVGWIDLTGLLKPGEASNNNAVLNGIAYDAAGKRLFVTGKLWPKLFEITLVPR